MLPQSLRATPDGVEIDGPDGSVRLRFIGGQIEAHYIGHELVNGSAQAYADSQLKEAVQAAQAFPLPWTYDSQGRQRITDYKQFYEQTFNSDLAGIEKLQHWTHSQAVGQHLKGLTASFKQLIAKSCKTPVKSALK